jgi:hypothetical protein
MKKTRKTTPPRLSDASQTHELRLRIAPLLPGVAQIKAGRRDGALQAGANTLPSIGHPIQALRQQFMGIARGNNCAEKLIRTTQEMTLPRSICRGNPAPPERNAP